MTARADHVFQQKRDDVAVLYVDDRGPYPDLVEQWFDEKRDARTYAGPLPIVAHPPCGPWASLRHLHERPSDAELAIAAICQVRRWGGVLEHPAGSTLFDFYGLPKPGWLPDSEGGYTIEVEQVRWGHVARKLTWLYLVGVDRELTRAMPPERAPTHWVSGGRKQHPKSDGGTVPAGIKVCSARQRRRTPIDFARWLIELAASSRRP